MIRLGCEHVRPNIPKDCTEPTSESSAGLKGGLYQDAVRRCSTPGKELGLERNAEDNDLEIGAAMHELYSTKIVRKISYMSI